MEIVNLKMNSKPIAPSDDDENRKPKDAKLNISKSHYMKLYKCNPLFPSWNPQ
jgi:hypothetical protein